MKKGIISILALSVAFASCNKDKSTSDSSSYAGVESIEDLKVPASFDWASAHGLTTDISVIGHEGMPKAKVRVDIYDKDPYDGGEVLWSGFTNDQGVLQQPIKLPTRYKEVVVLANTIGIGGNRITASTSGSTIRAHFSGVQKARIFDKNSSAPNPATPATNYGSSELGNPGVFYLSGFNSDGVPSNLTTVAIPQSLLDDLNTTLPEAVSVTCDSVRDNLLAPLFCNEVTTSKDDADVYVTFLGEGAGYDNALAYYYYPANNPPASKADIDSVFIIYPNATENNVTLQPGDRVKIGTFPKNTTIEWVLLGDQWNADSSRTEFKWRGTGPKNIYYSETDFNSDQGDACQGPNFQQHVISFTSQLNGEDIQIFSFEDLQYPYGDYDFNDCIFYASGDLYPSCSPQLGAAGNNGTDSDNDGIIDQYDDAPNDPDVACINTYEGTLVFEDLWPSAGDYDFNDNVTTYSIKHDIHALGYVHQVRADYTFKAAGAGYNNGFGTLLSSDLKKSDIVSVTGRTSTGNFVMDGDLTATPGSDLVIYNWDKQKDITVLDINVGTYFNTIENASGGKGNPVTENIVILFANNEVQQFELGLPPYNPFIFANQTQEREIHLADMEPSSLHNVALFGNADDDSNPGMGRYYKRKPNTILPWALDIPLNNFKWPEEKVEISAAYPDFATWASSGGTLNQDWYLNPNANVYQ